MKGVIYKIVSPTGRIYVGKSLNFKRRVRRYKCAECHKQVKLYASIKKYGWQAHSIEIIEEVDSGQLNVREQFWIKKLNACGERGMNCTEGGEGTVGHKHSEQSKRLMSIAKKGKRMKGKKVHKYKLNGEYVSSYANITDAKAEFKTKTSNISAVALGNRSIAFGFRWSFRKLKKLSPLKSVVKAGEGKKYTRSLTPIDTSKKVQKVKNGKVMATYKSTGEAARKTKIEKKNISATANGNRTKAGGFEWRFVK